MDPNALIDRDKTWCGILSSHYVNVLAGINECQHIMRKALEVPKNMEQYRKVRAMRIILLYEKEWLESIVRYDFDTAYDIFGNIQGASD